MAKITIGIGFVLIALGVGGYFGTGRESWTALIPAFFGLPLALLGVVALKDHTWKHAMHVAAFHAARQHRSHLAEAAVLRVLCVLKYAATREVRVVDD